MKDIPKNYTNTNSLHFETDLRSGHYSLELIPDIYFYKLTFPNGKVKEGSLQALTSSIKYDPTNPELNAWLLKSINWEEMKQGRKENKQKKEFSVGGRNYSISFDNGSGEIDLHFPHMMVVSERRNLSDMLPEIYYVKRGVLSELITSVIAESGAVINDDEDSAPITIPQFNDEIKYFEILGGWNVGIGYNPINDVLFLDLDSRTEHTHLFALPLDVPEFDKLNDGEYQEVVFQILVDNDMHVQ